MRKDILCKVERVSTHRVRKTDRREEGGAEREKKRDLTGLSCEAYNHLTVGCCRIVGAGEGV